MNTSHTFRGRNEWIDQPAVIRMVPLYVLTFLMPGWLRASDIPPPPSFEERLQAYGFATESDGDIQRILQDDMYVFRELGLRLVAERKGEQAIETLKQFLEDEKLPVRMTAASLLGKLGDSSGLPVMRQEYESLIGPEENQRDVEALRKLSPYATNPGLEVAEVLAEHGDYRGYHLALSVFGNKDSKILALRPSAMDVLGHIAQADRKVLASHGIDLHAAYDKAIDSADSTYLFQRIIVSINKEEFNPALASYVADRLLDTHRLPDWAEEHVRDTVKPRIELRRQQSQGNSRAGTTSGTRGLSAGATSRPASQPATLDDIRQANTANESAIRTARVVCVLQADDWWDRPPIPGSSPYSATVREINRHRLERREIWCDIPGQSWRLELTDLRDVDQLMEDAGLPPEQGINVSRSASWLSGQGYYATLYGPYQFMVLTRRPERTETSPQPPFGMETGVISDFLIADASAVTLADAERDGLSLVELRVTKESITWSVLLDPALNYRFRWWTRQTAEGQVQQEQVAGDYRKVNGIDYPFSYAERKWDAAGTLTEEKSINVEDAEFNMPLAREDLELLIPAGTSIQDMVSRARVKTPADVRVDIDSARELAPSIKAQQKEESPPPPSQPEEAPETQAAPDTQPSSEIDDADPEPSPETRAVESAPPSSSYLLSILGVSIIVLALVAVVILRVRRSGARYGAE